MKQLTNKQVYGAAIIIGIFIASAILTGFIETDDDYSDDNEYVEAPVDTVEIKKIPQSQMAQGDQPVETAKKPVRSPEVEGDPMEELNSLIGLNQVKAEVKSLSDLIKVQKEREALGMKNPDITYHCVFSGNPGTGKTTVARILARIYKNLGVLKSGHLVETDRSGLVAEYVGQTAMKTNELIDSALGGVLFIDEAYALADRSSGDYGSEAIATLLKRMEDDRDNLVVIVAGYTNEMEEFVASNPGLRSRFTRFINFPDYSSEELYGIFMLRVNRYGYKLDNDADAYLKDRLKYVFNHKNRNFGNGRYVRNLFESCVTYQSSRLSPIKDPTKEQLQQITKEDIENAYKQVVQ